MLQPEAKGEVGIPGYGTYSTNFAFSVRREADGMIPTIQELAESSCRVGGGFA